MPESRVLRRQSDTKLVDRVAAWLYAMDGSPNVSSEDAAQSEAVYLSRALHIIDLVRAYDKAPDVAPVGLSGDLGVRPGGFFARLLESSRSRQDDRDA